MRTETKRRAITIKSMRALALAALTVCGLAAWAAQANAAPAPALKLLAVSAPTHLPPVQSETQRITVEAEGGDYELTATKAKGSGTLDVATGIASVTKDNNQATVTLPFSGTFKAGQRVTGNGIPPNTIVLGVSGSVLELSNNATATLGFTFLTGTSKEVSGVSASSGSFSAGDNISGTGIPAGTTIAATGPGALTLSQYPTAGGTVALTATATTVPIAFDAPAATLGAALEAILSAGNVSVTGGPGGDAAHPYFVAFGGSLAEEDQEPLKADSALSGAHPLIHIFTTVPGGNGTGELYLLPANVGAQDSSGTVTAHLGPLPAGVVTSGPAEGPGWVCGGGAGESEVSCTTSEAMPAASAYRSGPVKVPVEVLPGAPDSATVHTELTGGGSVPAPFEVPLVVSAKPAPVGVAAAWGGSFEADGSPSVQAGGHPFQGSSYFMANTLRTARGTVSPVGDLKQVVVDLQPGFVGNPLASKRCPQSVPFPSESSDVCNAEMTVGTLTPYLTDLSSTLKGDNRLYNDVPAQGYAAEFTTRIVQPFQSVLATVNSEEDFGIRLTAPNIANYLAVYGAFTIFEGVPKDGNGQALLTNPVNCAESAHSTAYITGRANTWQDPDTYSMPFSLPQPTIVGCDKLEFEAEDSETGEGQVGFDFQPTSTRGSSPVGATAHLHIDQAGLTDPEDLATPELKRAVVKLPQGLSLNPSQANGLEACSEAQIGYRGGNFPMPNPMRFTEAQPRCPDGSKLGTAKIETPLLESPLVGEVFLAAQDENPFGSLIAIYLVVNDPRTGIVVKLPGKVDVGAGGQLTATFDNNPQLPFEDLTLNFRGGGPHSEFASPEVCGTYSTTGEWTPWSAPESGPPAQTTDGFDVSGNCASSPRARPFTPSFEAGTTNPKAGGYSPLVIKVGRNDGEQELSSLDFTMPPGFSGKLAGIPYCTEGDIAAAQSKSGKDEQGSPSCPSASRLGSVRASAGVGSDPFGVSGELYLAGPYKGAPVSAVAITPAVAGPFDLGNVVIRSPLDIDPETAQVSVASDPIPTALENIPLKVREVAITIDRPEFTLNPTSCEAMQVTAKIGSSDGATATPNNRFQVGGCRDLSFEPKTYLRLYGGTGRGAHPKLRAVYVTKPGEANLREGAFTIPRSEFLDQAHIRTVCTRVQFAASACPKGAVYGHVKAFSPIVDYPVSGPVYLRSSDNELPDLVFDLRGPSYQPVHVVVVLRIDSVRGQIRATVEDAPDLPVSKLIFLQQGGKKGLLVNSRNICSRRYRATVETEGHNGKRSTFKPVLSNSKCAKQRKAR